MEHRSLFQGRAKQGDTPGNKGLLIFEEDVEPGIYNLSVDVGETTIKMVSGEAGINGYPFRIGNIFFVKNSAPDTLVVVAKAVFAVTIKLSP